MQYVKIDNNTWVEINGETTRIVKKSDVEDELSFNSGQLDELPVSLTDEQKIAWYNENVDEEKNAQSRSLINAKIEQLEQTLSSLV